MTVADPIPDVYRVGDAGILAWATKISDFYNAYVNTSAHVLWQPSDFLTRPASAITYDNRTSGLTSLDVQAALDEVAGLIGPTFANVYAAAHYR